MSHPPQPISWGRVVDIMATLARNSLRLPLSESTEGVGPPGRIGSSVLLEWTM
jgi:hypothetical protein